MVRFEQNTSYTITKIGKTTPHQHLGTLVLENKDTKLYGNVVEENMWEWIQGMKSEENICYQFNLV